MRLPQHLVGLLPDGQHTFRFTVGNGRVKVLSVVVSGQAPDLDGLEATLTDAHASGMTMVINGQATGS